MSRTCEIEGKGTNGLKPEFGNSSQQDLALLRECLVYSHSLNTVLWCAGKHWEFFPLPAQSLGKLAEETHIQMPEKSDLRHCLGFPLPKESGRDPQNSD